jgi:hypothetical protein
MSDSQDYVTAWMPDSMTLLFSSTRMGGNQIFRQRLDHETAEAVTEGPDDKSDAVPTPDGAWVLYRSAAQAGAYSTKKLMRAPVAGGPAEPVLEIPHDSAIQFDCPSRPASSCLMSRQEDGQLIFYALDPVQGQGKEATRTRLGPTAEVTWALSRDGSHIAVYYGYQMGAPIRILDLPDRAERDLPLPPGCLIWALDWAADGSALFAGATLLGRYQIARIGMDGKLRALLDRGRNQQLSGIQASPDGLHLAFSQQTFENNAWLLENF